ncbi:hypothetical protein GUITHDRAFT_162811 [Guillardia theta CCMP2712]|uniref:Zn(2)-C6 fungal-type domain-containing protein n=1 Tax=Guillardia theta (strain CCMP2712) TaxID=905079 RepID=L1JFE8_GUITC|nr:hypothetical protein GUITHDRAFT_162811 [Guillardia theta CCMP2712]EKX47226.1 hypothetical protein GUITHDRAFT_162811 [Guillardia theta CCMP2712]|eukprot:XP_005834206.1 hypothetical protein GUITHDRAFT_162811 [Guillardia theta CCMP2712]
MPESAQRIPSSVLETLNGSLSLVQHQVTAMSSSSEALAHNSSPQSFASPTSISPSMSAAQVLQQHPPTLNTDLFLPQQNFQQQLQLQLQIQQQLRDLQQKQLQLDMLQQCNLIAPKTEPRGIDPLLLIQQLQAKLSNNVAHDTNVNPQQLQSNIAGLFSHQQHFVGQEEPSNADEAVASLVALRNPQDQSSLEHERGAGEEARKRHRITTKRACDSCRRSKVKCEDMRPCTRCVRNGQGDLCSGSATDAEIAHDKEESSIMEAKRNNSVSSTDSLLPMDGFDSQLTEIKAKRCRVAKKMACDTCRRSKVRCDTERPCSRCVGLGQESMCMSSLGEVNDKKSPTDLSAHVSEEPKVPTFSAVLNADAHKPSSWHKVVHPVQISNPFEEARGSISEETSSQNTSAASSPPESLTQSVNLLSFMQPSTSKSLDLSALLALNSQNQLLNSLTSPLSLGLLANNTSVLGGLRPSVQFPARDYSEPCWDLSAARLTGMPLLQGVVMGR